MKLGTLTLLVLGGAWLGLSAWFIVADPQHVSSHPFEIAVLATGVCFIALAGWLTRGVLRERRRLRDTFDAMAAGVVVFDADDRLVLANADFRRLYQLDEGETSARLTFESLLRSRVQHGLVPEAIGQEEAWIAQRQGTHRESAQQSFVREMSGDRWRRITEQRLNDGSRLGFSIDVTDLIESQRALDAARHEAERAHRLLREAIEAMPAAVEIYDRGDRLVLFNQRLLRIYPHMREQTLLGETFETLVRRALAQGQVPEAIGQEERWLEERLATRGLRDAPRLQRGPDGAWHHIYETPMPSGGLIVVRLNASDTVAQREALAAARDEATAHLALLRDAIEALPEGFALYDDTDHLLLCNQRYREIYRDSAPALTIGAGFESILRYGLEHGQYPQARANPDSWLAERLRRHRYPDGVPMLQELPGNRWLRIDERRTSNGGVAGVRTDVTELVRTRQELEASRRSAEEVSRALSEANARLEALSTTDALTGVANRRRFDARLAEEVQRAQRHGTPLALLLADVDHFKRYNDRHGHPQGDRALQAVAAVLREHVRRPGELLARYGGEEFALLLPHADAVAAERLGRRCCEAVAALAWPHEDSPTAAHLTLSIGVASLRVAAREGAASLVIRADAALYGAKAAGRARCVMAVENPPPQ